MSYCDIYSQETTSLDTYRINEIVMKDVVKPYLDRIILPPVRLNIEGHYPQVDYSIYGKLRDLYKKPEIPDSLKNLMFVVDIQKYDNQYLIYGWRNDKLTRVVSIFDSNKPYKECEKIEIGNYYDIPTIDYFATLGPWAPFNTLDIRYYAYAEENGRVTTMFLEPEIGIYKIYFSPALNGLFLCKDYN